MLTGPFSPCHDFVDPTDYHTACKYDLCARFPDDDYLCDSLNGYASACRQAGGAPEDWRSETTPCGKSSNVGVVIKCSLSFYKS